MTLKELVIVVSEMMLFRERTGNAKSMDEVSTLVTVKNSTDVCIFGIEDALRAFCIQHGGDVLKGTKLELLVLGEHRKVYAELADIEPQLNVTSKDGLDVSRN